MSFTLKIKDKIEEREIDGELTIKELLDDLDLSSETMVSKKNGEIVIDEEIIEDGDEMVDKIFFYLFNSFFLIFNFLLFLYFHYIFFKFSFFQ